jgi:uncharacterized protein
MSPRELDSLLEVQDLDLAIDQRRHRLARLPERAELATLDAEADQAGRELRRMTEARDEFERRESQAEAELAATEQRAAAVRRRLYGGEVSASRELQAMAADLEALESRASALEDAGLALLEEREPIDAELGRVLERVDSLEQRRTSADARLGEASTVVTSEIATLTEERQVAAAHVSANLLATYERLRARLGGIGAARLVGNHCDGCHLVVSAAELDRIRHLAPGEVATCEQCARILVAPGVSPEPA